jgi:DNA integrity scanning protein DisA with diadenylate cyclase activity
MVSITGKYGYIVFETRHLQATIATAKKTHIFVVQQETHGRVTIQFNTIQKAKLS